MLFALGPAKGRIARRTSRLTLLLAAALLAPGASASAAVRLHVRPATAAPGSSITISGTGLATATILVGPPRSEADPVGTARTNAHGSFSFRLRIPANAQMGRFVALGCQRGCRVKASASFRIARSSRRANVAVRRATKAETTAIRRAALRTLHGSGWRVSNVRVSTVRAKHGYASAAVDNTVTGVGGEMLLRRTGTRWARAFLGTDDFCASGLPRSALRDLGFRC
jgi:hypothetical protein